MRIDTEIKLKGEAAVSFHNMMRSVDLEAISARDEFLADASSQLDESGILSIDISDIELDLSVLDDGLSTIESIITPEKEIYIGDISVNYTYDVLKDLEISNAHDISYKENNNYASSGMYSVNQSLSISYAA